MIGIVDYGMGNLFSVSKALERLEAPFFLSEDKEQLEEAGALLVPGVGAFPDAMQRLNETGLSEMIRKFAAAWKPVLGICLGTQLLFEESMENGATKGLGLLSGRVERFSGITSSDGSPYKVPHMGWNKLKLVNPSPLTDHAKLGHVYFVHSYYVKTEDKDVLIAVSEYDVEVPAVVGKNNVFGMQFHPEKSSQTGMELLKNFTKLAATDGK